MKKLFLLAATATMMFASCSKTDFIYQDETPQEIGLFSVAKNQTKAAPQTTNSLSYDMAVAAYLVNGSTTPGNYFPYTKFTKQNDGTWTGGRYWPISSATINFFAVAPEVEDVVETVFDETTHTSSAVTTLTDNSENQYDVMVGVGTGVKTDNNYSNVPVALQHALAWINFGVKTNVTTDGYVVKVNSIVLNGAYYSGTLTSTTTNPTASISLDPATAFAWTDQDDATDAIATPNATDGAKSNLVNNANYTEFGDGILVVPAEYANEALSFTINYTIQQGASEPEHTFNYTHKFAATTWAPNKKYTYNVSINLNEIKVAATVGGWDEQVATTVPIN